MALEQHLSQEQKLIQQQQQRLTAQQILQVRLLEMPLTQLEENIKTELYENPALESEQPEDASLDVRTADGDVGNAGGEDAFSDDASFENEGNGDSESAEFGSDTDAYEASFEAQTEREEREDALDSALDSIDSDDRLATDYRTMGAAGGMSDDNQEEIVYGNEVSFYDKLMEQVADEDLTERQRTIIEYLIGSLDNDGLLRTDIVFISDDLAIYHEVDATEREIEDVLRILQSFDPPGIGARSLQECLLLQIRRRENSLMKKLMYKAIKYHFDDFTKKHWDKLRSGLRISDEEVEAVVAELRRLNPRPGASLGETMGRSIQQVTPDFIIDPPFQGHISFQLNNGELPHLFISRDFEEQMMGYMKNQKSLNRMEKEALLYTKEKIERAKGYIEAIEKRRNNLTATMRAIIDLQHKYFLEGDESELQPMTLKDVADRIGLDISTISRVCNAKYAETPWGIFPLKHFFSSGMSFSEGEEEMSNRKIKAALQEIIDKENKKRPLSDQALSEAMKKIGLPIARRTVAKYREAMGIPVARLRK